jgi:hypothetical protein
MRVGNYRADVIQGHPPHFSALALGVFYHQKATV